MRDPIITEAIVALREHQADLRLAGCPAEAAAGDGYIARLEQRFPDRGRAAPLLTDRRRK